METQTNKLSKYQSFVAVTIERKQILNAPYNPRKISDHAAKGLRKQLKKHGLVDTIVWNKRTGNLVGGHQRLTQLDLLEKSQDYLITVSQIDVDLKQEKEINIVLNNIGIQGTYDFEALKQFDGEIDWGNTGFTDEDLNVFGIIDFINEDNETKESKDTKENIEKIKAAKKESKDKSISKGENYFVVTFPTIKEKEDFLLKLDCLKNDRYITADFLLKHMKE